MASFCILLGNKFVFLIKLNYNKKLKRIYYLNYNAFYILATIIT